MGAELSSRSQTTVKPRFVGVIKRDTKKKDLQNHDVPNVNGYSLKTFVISRDLLLGKSWARFWQSILCIKSLRSHLLLTRSVTRNICSLFSITWNSNLYFESKHIIRITGMYRNEALLGLSVILLAVAAVHGGPLRNSTIPSLPFEDCGTFERFQSVLHITMIIFRKFLRAIIF